MTANRDRDQAQLQNAEAILDRYTLLESKGYATAQLVDTQKAQASQLQNAVKADQALIYAANVQLSYTRLTSPAAVPSAPSKQSVSPSPKRPSWIQHSRKGRAITEASPAPPRRN